MMKEEKILKDMFGKENHFAVPEGYFDSFADNLMDQLPESEARMFEMRAQSWWNRLPMRKIAAAASVAIILGGGSMLYVNHHSQRHVPMASSQVDQSNGTGYEYGTFEQMADYTMMDNQDFYASLVAEN